MMGDPLLAWRWTRFLALVKDYQENLTKRAKKGSPDARALKTVYVDLES